MKNEIITFKVDTTTKERFQMLCEEEFTTPSQVLRHFIMTKIREYDKLKKAEAKGVQDLRSYFPTVQNNG